MKEQLISFETAKLAKEQGFYIMCEHGFAFHNESQDEDEKWSWWIWLSDHYEKHLRDESQGVILYGRPTQSLLQKWLREEHIIVVNAYANASGYCWEMHYTPVRGGSHVADSGYTGSNESGNWDTYEEALEKGLQEALKLSKQ